MAEQNILNVDGDCEHNPTDPPLQSSGDQSRRGAERRGWGRLLN